MFGLANVSMCTCTALNSSCTKITSHSRQYAKVDQSCTQELRILRLQPFRFKVKYLPGEQNIADPLSRLQLAENQAGPSATHKVSDEFVRFGVETATPRDDDTRA